MIFRRTLAVFGLTAALSWLAPPAIAQIRADSDAARRHFDEGVRMLDAARFRDALVELEAARRLDPRWSVYFNLALAQRGLGMNRAALGSLQHYLELDHNVRRNAEAHRYVQELTAGLAHVEFELTPVSARARIDDEDVPADARRFDVDPGSHRIVVSANGFSSETRTVDLAAGNSLDLRVTLVAVASSQPAPSAVASGPPSSMPVAAPVTTTAHLHVDTDVPTAIVRIDGRDLGTGTADLDTEGGTHTVDVVASGRRTYHTQLTVRPGERLTLRADLPGAGSHGLAIGLGVSAGAVVVGGVIAAVVLGLQVRPAVYRGPWGTIAPKPEER